MSEEEMLIGIPIKIVSKKELIEEYPDSSPLFRLEREIPDLLMDLRECQRAVNLLHERLKALETK